MHLGGLRTGGEAGKPRRARARRARAAVEPALEGHAGLAARKTIVTFGVDTTPLGAAVIATVGASVSFFVSGSGAAFRLCRRPLPLRQRLLDVTGSGLGRCLRRAVGLVGAVVTSLFSVVSIVSVVGVGRSVVAASSVVVGETASPVVAGGARRAAPRGDDDADRRASSGEECDGDGDAGRQRASPEQSPPPRPVAEPRPAVARRPPCLVGLERERQQAAVAARRLAHVGERRLAPLAGVEVGASVSSRRGPLSCPSRCAASSGRVLAASSGSRSGSTCASRSSPQVSRARRRSAGDGVLLLRRSRRPPRTTGSFELSQGEHEPLARPEVPRSRRRTSCLLPVLERAPLPVVLDHVASWGFGILGNQLFDACPRSRSCSRHKSRCVVKRSRATSTVSGSRQLSPRNGSRRTSPAIRSSTSSTCPLRRYEGRSSNLVRSPTAPPQASHDACAEPESKSSVQAVPEKRSSSPQVLAGAPRQRSTRERCVASCSSSLDHGHALGHRSASQVSSTSRRSIWGVVFLLCPGTACGLDPYVVCRGCGRHGFLAARSSVTASRRPRRPWP